ncbi:MAG: alanine racemase [Pyrinomonadaceae bacterium]
MTSENTHRPTRTEIDLDNLAFNFNSVKEFVGDDVKYMAVVKADAYGHGAVECALRLESAGVDWFGVALPEEGIELRKAGIGNRILCLGSFWPGQEEDLLDHKITPVIYQIGQAELFDSAAAARNISAEFHLKIDTGMNRIGIRYDRVEEFADRLKQFENISLEGVMTHFAAADDLGENEFTRSQIGRFNRSVELLENKGFKPVFKDLANSPASVAHPDSYGNMVRLGGVLYGLGDDILPKEIPNPALKPVLSMYSEIAYLKNVPAGETVGYSRTHMVERDSVIASIPVGYHDGFRRGLSNRACVLVKGQRVPVVGRVSMDWTLLDVTDVHDCETGERVTLIGVDKNEKITAAELARSLETISYEITCGISRRVERRFLPARTQAQFSQE